MWAVPETKGISGSTRSEDEKLKLAAGGCDSKTVSALETKKNSIYSQEHDVL